MPTQQYRVLIERWEQINAELRKVMRPVKPGTNLRVPGTTTVTGRYKDSGALIAWANREGLEGRPIRGEGSKVEVACEAGTLTHLLVECDIRGLPEPDLSKYPEEIVDKATSGFSAYLDWKHHTNLKPHHTELALTSSSWLFGGTIDSVQIDGKVALLDWKTSGGIYSDMLYQVGGGYALLWNQAFPDMPLTGGIHIVRFSKVEGDFAHHWWANLSLAEEGFRHMRILYEIDKQIKERV